MPRFHRHELHASEGLRIGRVLCDGVDRPPPREEVFDSPRIIVALSGCFAVRGPDVRAVVDPTCALLVAAGGELVISHPRGHGDVCVAVTGRVAGWMAAAIADRGHTVATRALGVAAYAQLRALDRHLESDGAAEPGAVEELFCAALAPAPAPAPSRRDRAIVEGIAHELAIRFDERLRLDHLAARVGVSVFHACRVFRRVAGTSIHRYRLELRLRHALAAILDGDRLADVALATGFASQAHLTTCFGRRFGVTPARARSRPFAATVGLRARDARPGT